MTISRLTNKVPCVECHKEIIMEMMKADDPQSPTFTHLPIGAWWTMIRDEQNSVHVVISCSKECTDKILSK